MVDLTFEWFVIKIVSKLNLIIQFIKYKFYIEIFYYIRFEYFFLFSNYRIKSIIKKSNLINKLWRLNDEPENIGC